MVYSHSEEIHDKMAAPGGAFSEAAVLAVLPEENPASLGYPLAPVHWLGCDSVPVTSTSFCINERREGKPVSHLQGPGGL